MCLNKIISSSSVNVGESRIMQHLKVKDLCVIFDQFLKFDNHITVVCGRAHIHIRNMGKIRNLLAYNTCSTIIHTLIFCRAYFYNSMMYNVPTNKADRLQKLQKQCARRLTKSSRREHITRF